MSGPEGHALRNAALRAIFGLIDANRHHQTTSGQRIDMLDNLAKAQNLMKMCSSGVLVPYEHKGSMYELLRSSRHYRKPDMFGKRVPTMDELWQYGSTAMKEDFLIDIGLAPSQASSSAPLGTTYAEEPQQTPHDGSALAPHFGRAREEQDDLVIVRHGKRTLVQAFSNDAVEAEHHQLSAQTRRLPCLITPEQGGTVEIKMKKSEVKEVWDNMLNMITDTIVGFLASCMDQGNGDAVLVQSAAQDLQMLYDTVLGKNRHLIRENLSSGLLKEFNVLLSLVGAVVGEVFEMPEVRHHHGPLDPADERIGMLLEAMKARNCEDILYSTNFSWVSSSSYEMKSIKPEASRLSGYWTDVLMPHLQLIYQRTATHERRFYECLTVFEEKLNELMFSALSLRARLRVAGTFVCSRPSLGAVLDKKSMQELNMVLDPQGFRVTHTILPVLKKVVESHQTIFCKAVVVVHKNIEDKDDDAPVLVEQRYEIQKSAANENIDGGRADDREPGKAPHNVQNASTTVVPHEAATQFHASASGPQSNHSHTTGVLDTPVTAQPSRSDKVHARQDGVDFAPSSTLMDTKKASASIAQLKDISTASKTTAILQSPDRQYLADVEVELCKRIALIPEKFLLAKRKLFQLFAQHQERLLSVGEDSGNQKRSEWTTYSITGRLGINNTKAAWIFKFFKDIGFFEEKYFRAHVVGIMENQEGEEDELEVSSEGSFKSAPSTFGLMEPGSAGAAASVLVEAGGVVPDS